VAAAPTSTFAFRDPDSTTWIEEKKFNFDNRYQMNKSHINPYVQPKKKVVRQFVRSNSGDLSKSKRPKSSTENRKI